MKISITTLGCKINQFDSGVVRSRLLAEGAEIVGEGEAADVYIINTCSVTKKSDYQSRQTIRRAVKNKPEGGKVIVTGCYARTNPGEITAIPGVDVVADDLDGLSLSGGMEQGLGEARRGNDAVRGFTAQSISGRSRAFLKVQEGCDAHCSYCIVPHARGNPRSAPLDGALEMADRLIAQGYHEIVLTGVSLGAYGKDLGGGLSLSGLAARLLERPGLGRLRLSSIEPMEFDDGLFALMGHEKLCRHFHIPLQSGEAGVLASMGRHYSPDEYFRLVERISRTVPGACIGADVITGYPHEDRASFEETYRRIEGSPVNYLHVFSYSPRPGTRSIAFGDPVRGDEKKDRTGLLRGLAARKNREFRESFIGKTMRVVVEEKRDMVSGLTDNYMRVSFDSRGIASCSAVDVIINDVTEEGCKGVLA